MLDLLRTKPSAFSARRSAKKADRRRPIADGALFSPSFPKSPVDEGLRAEGLTGRNPKDAGSLTTMTVVAMEYAIFAMGGYDTTVSGYWKIIRKAEQDSKEEW